MTWVSLETPRTDAPGTNASGADVSASPVVTSLVVAPPLSTLDANAFPVPAVFTPNASFGIAVRRTPVRAEMSRLEVSAVSVSASVFTQDLPVLKETQLLSELERLSGLHRQWAVELREDSSKSRQRFSLPEYRAWYLQWQQRIQNGYAELSRCYEMVSRVYRTNPKSPLYPRLRDTYLQAKRGFDQLQAFHAELALPDEKLPIIEDRQDGKLRTHLLPIMNRVSIPRSKAIKENNTGGPTGDRQSPVGETSGETPAGETPAGETPAGETPAGETPAGETPASTAPSDTFLQVLQQSPNLVLEYIGSFDLIEVYLLRQPEHVYYIMYGWRQSATRDGEDVLEVDPHFIIAGPLSMPLAVMRKADSAWHFEQLMQLSPFPLKLEHPLLEQMMSAMARSRTYIRRRP